LAFIGLVVGEAWMSVQLQMIYFTLNLVIWFVATTPINAENK
jgi:hypothetical protein